MATGADSVFVSSFVSISDNIEYLLPRQDFGPWLPHLPLEAHPGLQLAGNRSNLHLLSLSPWHRVLPGLRKNVHTVSRS